MWHKNWMKTGLAVLTAVGIASAHLSLSGAKPAGGETVAVGDTLTIAFTEGNNHGFGVDIALSRDGGTTWTDIKKAFTDQAGANTFKWKVEGAATTMAKIRICQFGSSAKTPCADSEGANVLGDGSKGHYILVSPAFTISGTSALRPVTAGTNPFSVDFRPESRNVDVSFGLTEGKEVLLQAFDSQGRLLATLVQGAFAAGSHKLSLAAKGLDASGGSLVFKMKIGNQVQSHTWMSIR